jgi:hypothetical protein
MKTVFHANIDGQEVVLGFGEAHGLIDPVATAVKIAPLLAACEEQKQMSALNRQIDARRQEAGQAFALADQARRAGDSPTMTRQNAEYQAKLLEAAELEKQLAPRVAAFERARARIVTENAAYFGPPQGEDLITDEQAAELRAKYEARGANRQLLLTGDYIADFRGREYWIKGARWERRLIQALGELPPAGGIPPEALTDEQRQEISTQQEADRLVALTSAELAAEAERARAQALAQAAQMRSQLEIAGDPDALAKSQEYYQGELAAIEAKYSL